MNTMFLDPKPKVAAQCVPSALRAKEIEMAQEVLSSAVRITRGRPGELLQTVRNAFGVRVQRIDSYPYTLTEEETTPDQPYIKLALDTTHPCLMWVLASANNMKWMDEYLAALCKLQGMPKDENLNRALSATEFVFEFKGLTPPPMLMPKGAHCVNPWGAYRRHLHTKRFKLAEGEVMPTWWMPELHAKLTAKKPKKTAEPQQPSTQDKPTPPPLPADYTQAAEAVNGTTQS